MIDYQWLAEIRVNIEGEKYALSTGVPVSRRHVLTTGHGVPGVDNEETYAEVRFIADFRDKLGWRKAKTVWHGGEDIDAALLEIAEVPELVPAYYAATLPQTTTSWEGAGFPAASKITDGELAGNRESKGLHGKYQPGGNKKSEELDLTVESSPIADELWAGISGAPVFCESKLIGIVKSCPENFSGNSLSAIAMRRLLQNSAFSKLLGHDEREELLAAKQASVESLLTDSKEVLLRLQAQPALHGIAQQPKATAKALLNLKIIDFLRTVHHANSRPKLLSRRARGVMETLLGECLPLLYDKGVIEKTRLNLAFGMLVALPVATETIAEIIMAGVDRRPAFYRRLVTSDEFPIGAGLVEKPPESGFSLGIAGAVAAFDNHMINKYAKSARKRESRLEELRKIVNGWLRFIAEEQFSYRYRHYFIYPKLANEIERQTLVTLQEYYPELVFISLDGDSVSAELDDVRHLIDFLASKPGEKAT